MNASKYVRLLELLYNNPPEQATDEEIRELITLENFPLHARISSGNIHVREALYRVFDGKDFYTGRDMYRTDMSVDHIIPVSSGGPSNVYNYAPTTKSENSRKWAYCEIEKMREVLAKVRTKAEKTLSTTKRLREEGNKMVDYLLLDATNRFCKNNPKKERVLCDMETLIPGFNRDLKIQPDGYQFTVTISADELLVDNKTDFAKEIEEASEMLRIKVITNQGLFVTHGWDYFTFIWRSLMNSILESFEGEFGKSICFDGIKAQDKHRSIIKGAIIRYLPKEGLQDISPRPRKSRIIEAEEDHLVIEILRKIMVVIKRKQNKKNRELPTWKDFGTAWATLPSYVDLSRRIFG